MPYSVTYKDGTIADIKCKRANPVHGLDMVIVCLSDIEAIGQIHKRGKGDYDAVSLVQGVPGKFRLVHGFRSRWKAVEWLVSIWREMDEP